MKITTWIAVAAITAGAAACSKTEECTPEILSKKAQDLTVAIQQKLTAEPAKAQELMKKFQEVGVKFQSATDKSQACAAYDDLLNATK